jgi:Family of unknown function (DUF6221)
MTDLVKFLRARLDERAAKAREAMRGSEGRWTQVDREREAGRIEDDRGEPVSYYEGAPTEDQADHMVANDPAYVLRDVESKRRIIERYERQAAKASESAMEEDRAWTLEPVLWDLALSDANHRDYQQEWKP